MAGTSHEWKAAVGINGSFPLSVFFILSFFFYHFDQQAQFNQAIIPKYNFKKQFGNWQFQKKETCIFLKYLAFISYMLGWVQPKQTALEMELVMPGHLISLLEADQTENFSAGFLQYKMDFCGCELCFVGIWDENCCYW